MDPSEPPTRLRDSYVVVLSQHVTLDSLDPIAIADDRYDIVNSASDRAARR
jgi:hypothetical protein